MRRLTNVFFISVLSMMALSASAQKGFLRGKVIDDELGEGIIGSAVFVEGTTTGSVTDWDGNYSLALEPGTYSIVFSSVSYQRITVSDVVITAEEVTPLDVRMVSDLKELEAVVVTAEVVRDSETAMLTLQKKSANVLDGISSQAFKKTGDSNLGAAMNRVTGVSVEDGKYVYVRGLGDRYTKTTLNGLEVPGLDPDKNSIQIDIFPTSVLENVMVYKTFSPNLFGDFTGGIVNIETKAFPEEKVTEVSLGLGATFGQTFNSDYKFYQGGKLDWLGFDDGTRALPFDRNTEIPSEVRRDPELERLTRSFNPNMAAHSTTALPSGSLSFVHGNQVNRGIWTIGYNAILNYQNSTVYFSEFEANRYLKDPDVSEYELFADEKRLGDRGQNNVLWSGLLSSSFKVQNHSFTVSFLRSQNGESNASTRVSRNFNQTNATLVDDILTYTQRSVSNLMISGKHNLGNGYQVEWANALNWSRVYDPDFRETKISVTDGDTTLQVGDGAGIERFYRDLNEFNESFKVDLTKSVGERSKLRAGAYTSFKNRDFQVDNFIFRQRLVASVPADADWFLQPENIWTPDTRRGTYVIGNYQAPNNYEARQNIYAAYGMGELFVTPSLRAIFGVRVEQNSMWYTGENIGGTEVYDDEKTLEELNVLPSMNLVYNLSENINFRASYNRTVARPSFKEKSIAQIYDPISKKTFFGNLDLDQTDIDNVDLRVEYFFRSGELISVSGFYKNFNKHIEYTLFPFDPDAIKPRNAEDSWVYGAEVEFRKSLDFIPQLRKFSFGTNLSLISSQLDITTLTVDNDGTTEYELREANLREGETLSTTRSMAGQAPYLVNAYIGYLDEETNTNVKLSYNVQGETLTVVGSGTTPDVYTKPFHSLNLNMYRNFGQERKSRVTVSLRNILNDDRLQVYKSYGASEQVYTGFKPGVNFRVKYNYKF